jgi:hypothetical protein
LATNLWSDDGFVVSNMTPLSGTLQCDSIDTGLVAAGNSAGTALALVSTTNLIATAAASTGVRLPAAVAPGAMVRVLNGGANAISVYPPTGGKVNGTTANTADTSTVAAVSSGVPGKQTYIQDGTLTSGVPNYLRIA